MTVVCVSRCHGVYVQMAGFDRALGPGDIPDDFKSFLQSKNSYNAVFELESPCTVDVNANE